MPTVSYQQMLRELVEADPNVGEELFEGAIVQFDEKDFEGARILLRQYISSTVGIKVLSARSGISKTQIKRALSTKGNSTQAHLRKIISALSSKGGFQIER
jgi:DNA-binding phage protein